MSELDSINNPDALVVWTIQEARQLSREDPKPRERDANSKELLENLAAQALQTISQLVNPARLELESETLTGRSISHNVERPEQDTYAEPPQNAPSVSTANPAKATSPLFKAIVKPDIYTAPIDRNRAIDLRWILRDIRSNRLKLSPVDRHDLDELMELGLVEISDNAPALTNVGIAAIS
jgi:hypothetical protein